MTNLTYTMEEARPKKSRANLLIPQTFTKECRKIARATGMREDFVRFMLKEMAMVLTIDLEKKYITRDQMFDD